MSQAELTTLTNHFIISEVISTGQTMLFFIRQWDDRGPLKTFRNNGPGQ